MPFDPDHKGGFHGPRDHNYSELSVNPRFRQWLLWDPRPVVQITEQLGLFPVDPQELD